MDSQTEMPTQPVVQEQARTLSQTLTERMFQLSQKAYRLLSNQPEPTPLPDPHPEVWEPYDSFIAREATQVDPVNLSRNNTDTTLVGTPPQRGQKRALDEDEPSTGRNLRRKLDPKGLPSYLPAQTPSTTPGVHEIAHSHRHIHYLGLLSWGVQWEICRLVSLGKLKWEDIRIQDLEKLKGSNADTAHRVIDVLLGKKGESLVKAGIIEQDNKSPWEEMDTERENLQKDPLSGLGRSSGWYGGKVLFSGKLSLEGKRNTFSVTLNPPKLGPSFRFARRFGSESFLRIKVPQKIQRNEALQIFFCQKFIIAGRVFRSYFEKDGSVYMVLTDEPYEKGWMAAPPYHADLRVSLVTFINSHNPLKDGSDQAVMKWRSRMALGLSNSVPALYISPANIHKEDDIYSESFSENGKALPEQIMTDGCGSINMCALRSIQTRLQLETTAFPVVFQVRLGGAKGLLLMNEQGPSTVTGDEPRVCLRESQIKTAQQDNHPANLILDIVRPPSLRSPVSLSAEVICNLVENGVPPKLICKLMETLLKQNVEGLSKWTTRNDLLNLWVEVAKAGGVMGMRAARAMGGTARARGRGSYKDEREEVDDDENDDEDDDRDLNRPLEWYWDPFSGCPASIYETVLALLDAGFRPDEQAYLRDKLKKVIEFAIESYIKKFHILLPMSCNAFIAPDPYGELEEGTVFIKSSMPLEMPDGTTSCVIDGDVLVTRHPCKVPSDVQKVRAVDCAALRRFTDVIIFSTRGQRSLASMLGGGDYDGDIATVIWHPDVVKVFRNANPKYADPPPGFDRHILKEKESVAELLQRIHFMSEKDKLREIQKVLTDPLKRDQSIVGTYSTWHEKAIYRYGYGSNEAWRLAYIFTTCLDGVKSGLTVHPKTFSGDKQQWSSVISPWKTQSDFEKEGNLPNLKRDPHLPAFILESLVKVGARLKDEILYQFSSIKVSSLRDRHLIAPWEDANDRANLLATEHGHLLNKEALADIESHVKSCQIEFKGFTSSMRSPRKAGYAAKPPPVHAHTQERLRNISMKFKAGPQSNVAKLVFSNAEVDRLKASCAYRLDDHENPRFSFSVAMCDLGKIKAEYSGQGLPKAVTGEFYAWMNVTKVVQSLT